MRRTFRALATATIRTDVGKFNGACPLTQFENTPMQIENFLQRAFADGHLQLISSGKTEKIRYVAVNHAEKWSDPEEKVRANYYAELIYRYGYQPECIGIESACPIVLRLTEPTLLYSATRNVPSPSVLSSVSAMPYQIPSSSRQWSRPSEMGMPINFAPSTSVSSLGKPALSMIAPTSSRAGA